jgi:MoaA/NifB/PqqE/SkfB family radical SAM enzyme
MKALNKIKNLSKNINAFANPNQVGYIIFYVTNRCNFRCKFCFYYAEIEKGRKPEELTLDQIDKISKSTGSLLQLSLTGGEPFLRKDFAELTEIWIKNTGVKYITIPTNASLDDRMVRYFEYLLPKFPDTCFRLAISIDGIEDEHDTNRSMPGSFKKIQETFIAMKALKKKYRNLVLDSNTVFTANTQGRIIKILDYINKNFSFDNQTITYVRGDIKDPNLKVKAEKEYREMNQFLENLERQKEKFLLYPLYRGVRTVAWKNLMETVFEDKFVTPCVAGKKLLIISETGVVRPCEILDKVIGNLKDYDFDLKKLMKSKNRKDIYNWIVDTKCKCSFECALAANVTWNASQYGKVLKASASKKNF